MNISDIMPKKRNIFNESKDHFVNRKRNSGIRRTMHEDPLLGAKRDESVGMLRIFFYNLMIDGFI